MLLLRNKDKATRSCPAKQEQIYDTRSNEACPDRNESQDGRNLPREWCLEGGRNTDHDGADRQGQHDAALRGQSRHLGADTVRMIVDWQGPG
jgi:hypothetical protein